MINVSCHCGNVTLAFDQLPQSVRDCDCPICNRIGALWADFQSSDVTVKTTNSTITYSWGNKDYEMHHCPNCGCTTHYNGADADNKSELGVNLRMLDRRELEKIPIV